MEKYRKSWKWYGYKETPPYILFIGLISNISVSKVFKNNYIPQKTQLLNTVHSKIKLKYSLNNHSFEQKKFYNKEINRMSFKPHPFYATQIISQSWKRGGISSNS